MAQMTATETKAPACTIYEAGRPIGQVVEPRGERVIGRGEGTVLLKR